MVNLIVFIISCMSIIIVNLVYKPYKGSFHNYFHSIPELLYIVIYVVSFLLLPQYNKNLSEKNREKIANVMLISFLTILFIEFIYVICENFKALYNVLCHLFKRLKEWRNKKRIQ